MVFRKSEHRYTNVRENKVFGEEIKQLEQLFRPISRVRRQVIVGVVRLTYTTEQHCDDTLKIKTKQ